MAKEIKKEGLNLYRVTFYYHTNGSVLVKASSKEEALKRAGSVTITDDELIEGLQSDDSPDAELVEENVEPDKKDGIIMCNDSVIVNGTSFHGVTIISTVNKLEKVLGKPTNGNGGNKVNYEWKLRYVMRAESLLFPSMIGRTAILAATSRLNSISAVSAILMNL